MSAELLSSKVVVIEEEPKVRGVPSAPTSIAGAVGVTERGPVGEATLCSSYEEYQTTFGGFTTTSDLSLAASGFFENGGSNLWVVRTVHYTDPADANTATAVKASGFLIAGGGATPGTVSGSASAPLFLHDGDQLVISVNGGPDTTVVFNGQAASVAADESGPFALSNGQTLKVKVDGGAEQTIVFSTGDFGNIAAATALEVAAVINVNMIGGRCSAPGGVVTIESDTRGSASKIQVTGGTALGAFGFDTTVVNGSGNVARLHATLLSEIKSVVEGLVSGLVVSAGIGDVIALTTTATGTTASVRVQPASSVVFGFDNAVHSGANSGAANAVRAEGKDPGTYANNVQVEIRAASNGSGSNFDLLTIEDGVFRERFQNLSMTSTDDRYAPLVVNDDRTGSTLVRLTDLALPGSPVLTIQTVSLSGGNDGLSGLNDSDFVGSDVSKTGIYGLDTVQDLSILIVPGRASSAVHNAMVTYCEVARDGSVFAVLDPPASMSATDIITYVATTAALEGASEFAAIYWPRVKVLNPSKSVFGSVDQITVPPSGIVAGVFARTDSARPGGVYDPPAGVESGRMFGVLGFESDEVLEERKRDLIYPHRINPLTTGPGLPRYIDGSRTLKASGNFPFVAERRGVIFIERSLKTGLQFARHKNNTEDLRAQVRRTITAFLLTQTNNGAFRSRDPAKAFFVDVSDALNPPSVVFAGKLVARVGLATNKPAEFIILQISQDTRALDAELAAAV